MPRFPSSLAILKEGILFIFIHLASPLDMRFLVPAFAMFFICALVAPTAALAQDVPEIYVQRLSLSASQFTAGETISGSALLVNQGSTDAQNISYVVRLVGSYDSSGNPQATYSSDTFGPIYLKAGEEKRVGFSIVLPAKLPTTDLGIEMQAVLASGMPLGWQNMRITAKGASAAAPLSLVAAYLVAGDGEDANSNASFDLEAGPTIYKDKGHALLVIAIKNAGKDSVRVVPSTTIYDRSIEVGAPLFNQPAESIEIVAGKTATLAVPLPNFEYKPGVYAGVLSFAGADGQKVLETLSFRYIVGGDIAAIHAISSDKGNASAGETISVNVLFSGIPYDIARAVQRQPAAAFLAVQLFDERDRLVASSNVPVDLSNDGDVTVPLTADHTAQALRADVTILKDGNTLATSSVPLSALYDALHVSGGATVPLPILLGLIAVLLIAALLLYLVFLRKRRMPSTMPSVNKIPPMPGASLAIALAFAAALAFPAAAQAFSVTDYCWRGCSQNGDLPTVFVNTPAGELQPGQEFYVTGTMRSIQCTNRPQYIFLESSFGGITKQQGRGGGAAPAASGRVCFGRICMNIPGAGAASAASTAAGNFAQTIDVAYDVPWNGKWSHVTDRFSMGPFTAPSTPGSYRVNIGGAWDEQFKDGTGHGGVYGYQEFTVAGTPPVEENNPPGGTPGGGGNGGTGGNGTGLTCQANAHIENTTCVCNVGYLLSGGACVADQCHDGIDNDNDGTVDNADLGCAVGSHDDESAINDGNPSITITASPAILQPGQSCTVTWTTQDLVSCLFSGGGQSSSGLSGSINSGPLHETVSYTLRCLAHSGTEFVKSAMCRVFSVEEF